MKLVHLVIACSAFALVAGACNEPEDTGYVPMGAAGLTSLFGVSDSGYATTYDDPSDDGAAWGGAGFWGGGMYSGDPIDVTDPELAGDIGGIDFPTPTAATASGWEDGDYTSVEVMVEGNRGASMAIVEVRGGLDSLEPGTHRFSPDNGSGPTHVGVVGCSGRAAYNWDYDQMAESVEVVVTEDPETGARTYDFEADFVQTGFGASSDDTGYLSGSFRTN